MLTDDETDSTKPGDTDTDDTDADEEESRKEGCSAEQFECADKSACILTEWTCDGVSHCQDESDENDTTCPGKFCALFKYFRQIRL